MFVFKKKGNFPLKILDVFVDQKECEILIKTHIIGENKIEVYLLSELLEDETAIPLINPKDLLKLKEIEVINNIHQKEAHVIKIYFETNEVEIFNPTSAHVEILRIPDLFNNPNTIKKLNKNDLMTLAKKYYYFQAPKKQKPTHVNNIFKLKIKKDESLNGTN